MAKKLTFVMLVLCLMAFSTVVSMAINDDAVISENRSLEKAVGGSSLPFVNAATDEQYIEVYSHEAVIDEFGSLFFDKDSISDTLLLKDITVKRDYYSDNIQDYFLSATLADDVTLKDGNSIVVMVFVETDDTFELLGTPGEVFTKFQRMYKFRLPSVGEDKPNRLRIVAFPKNDYKDLALNRNLQIANESVTIQKQSKTVKDTLQGSQEALKKLVNVPQ